MFPTYFYVIIFQQNFKAMEDKFRKVRTVDEFGNVKYIPAHLAESCAATYNLTIEDLASKDEIRTLDTVVKKVLDTVKVEETGDFTKVFIDVSPLNEIKYDNDHSLEEDVEDLKEEETIIEGLEPIAETTVKTKTNPAKKK